MKGINAWELQGDASLKFKYTVREYDEKLRTVTVDYENGTWAKFKLMEPLPKDRDELEVYVRQFTDPVEYELALEDKDALDYIDEMVGKTYETGRRWVNPPPPPPEPEKPDDELSQIAEEIEAEIFGQNDMLSYEVSSRSMAALIDQYQKSSFLFAEPMVSRLTNESKSSLIDWQSKMLDLMQQAQAAMDANKRFDTEIPKYELKFKTEGVKK